MMQSVLPSVSDDHLPVLCGEAGSGIRSLHRFEFFCFPKYIYVLEYLFKGDEEYESNHTEEL